MHNAESDDTPRAVPRFAIYARFSSHMQKPQSLEDQIFLCRERVHALGGVVAFTYSDAAETATTVHDRNGLHELLEAARTGRIDAVCAEALDRISRDHADMADIFRRLRYHNVGLITLEEGEINAMHIGFKGVMNEAFVEALAHKTRRGQKGRVREGRIPGGLSYGYAIANKIGENGQAVRGLRKIDRDQARVIRRIYRLYAEGMSTRRIAAQLNAEGIPGPRGKPWTSVTINGHRKRRNGILNNELYRGVLTYNRQRFVRDPETGKRQARSNPRSQWTIQNVPAFRIIGEALWERVQKRRQAGVDRRRDPRARHAPLPLSPLVHCGLCGGRMTIQERRRYSCLKRRESGTCKMDRGIAARALETRATAQLIEWVAAQRDWPAVLTGAARDLAATHKRLTTAIAEIRERINNLLAMIEKGSTAVSLHQRLIKLEQEVAQLEIERDRLVQPPSARSPNLAALLRTKLTELDGLAQSTRATRSRHDALMQLSRLIERIEVRPGATRHETLVKVRPRRHALIAFALEGPRRQAPRTPNTAHSSVEKSSSGRADVSSA